MDKVATKEIEEDKWKEREEKKLKKTISVGFAVDWTIQREVEKWTKTQFAITWFPTIMKKWVINVIRIFIQTCEQIHTNPWAWILDVEQSLSMRLDTRQKVSKQHGAINQQGYYLHMNELQD
jgi:hypothetical protein